MGVLIHSKDETDVDSADLESGGRVEGTDGLGRVSRVSETRIATDDADALLLDGARAALRLRNGIASTLLASARHELRSPLQSIQGFAELLGSESYGSLSEEQHAFVEHILQGSLELGSVLEACLELAELEIEPLALEVVLTDAKSALSDALEHARESSGTTIQFLIGNGLQDAFVRVEEAALRRVFHALLTSLATGSSKLFRVDIALDGGQVRVQIGPPKRVGNTPLLSIDEFVRRRRATRSLIWLRLAAALLALQDGALRMTEQLDCVEVRLPLSSPH